MIKYWMLLVACVSKAEKRNLMEGRQPDGKDRQAASGSRLSPSLGSGRSLWKPSQWISKTDRDVHTC